MTNFESVKEETFGQDKTLFPNESIISLRYEHKRGA